MDTDAIVIGAGAAGLAAARALAVRSLRVVVIEARDRVGGRVWSQQVPGSLTPAELGAEFIHGPAETTMALLREANITAAGTASEAWVCAQNGELVIDDDDFTESARNLEGARELVSDVTAEAYLARLARGGTARQTIDEARAFIEGFEAADPALASARAIAEELHSGVDYRSARPVGGYGPMFELLRKACDAKGVAFRLSTIVKRVRWHSGAVSIDVSDPTSAMSTLLARSAIVTLPVGVLQSNPGGSEIAFEPDLPAAKRNALANIQMGHVAKVVLSFRSPFWERINGGRYHDAGFFHCASHPFAAYWTQLPARSNLIVAWAGGPKATALLPLGEAGVCERAVQCFGDLFNERKLASEQLDSAVMHDWNSDPFSRGAYSYVLVGGGDARRELGAPALDTLFFAGEATSTDGQGGTVSGALATGARAAAEAAAALGVNSQPR